jgi:hypothetical protein
MFVTEHVQIVFIQKFPLPKLDYVPFAFISFGIYAVAEEHVKSIDGPDILSEFNHFLEFLTRFQHLRK